MNVDVERVEGFRIEARARGVSVIVDRLPEQGGPGDGFRPVELLLAALGTCMVGTMLSFADNQGIDVRGVRVALEPTIARSPERVERVEMTMELQGELSDRQLASLKRVAEGCKIHNTLHRTTETALAVRVTAGDPIE